MTLPRISPKAAACDGKTTYTRMSIAENAAKWLARYTDERFSPYKCRHCGKYHIGATDDRRRRGKRPQQERNDDEL